MSKMRKYFRTKLRSAFSKPGSRSGGKDRVGGNSLSSKFSVNEEYLEVFRTNSYVEMWDRVHAQLPRTSSSISTSRSTKINRRSLSLPNLYMDRSENLLEPQQQIVKEMITNEGLRVQHILTEFFEASLDACHICDLILRSIHQTRAEYRNIKKLILKLSQRVQLLQDITSNIPQNNDNNNNSFMITDGDEQCRALFRELTAFALVKNPLSIISPVQFCEIHESYLGLFHRLTLKHKKAKRAAKRNRICKKVGGVGLVVANTALLIALLVFAIHSVIGIVAAPMMACSLGLCTRKMQSAQGWMKTRFHENHGQQLDVAAKGVYILVNDFDTMSRMVRRLQDEVEHRKTVAGMCVTTVKNGHSNWEIFKEVVREFNATESGFVDQLEELEEHIYLCLLTINRSRRLVIQEILATSQL